MADRHKGIEKREASNGEISYRAKVRIKGYPSQSATFARLTDAVRWKQQTETDVRRGKYFQTAEARKHTFGQLVDRYIETVLPRKPKIAKKQATQLLWWKDQIGERLLSDVNTALIVELRDKLLAGVTYRHTKRSPATVNRYLAVLSHAFSVAVNEWQWLSESPMRKLKLKESNARDRRLSDDERDRLLQTCKESINPYLYLVVLIALSTGLRLMEILSLRFSDIQWKENICLLSIKNTKNSRPHVVPLIGPAVQLLIKHAKLRRIDRDLVFPARKGFKERPAVIRSAWDEAITKADIKDFTFHSLRHTAASWLAQLNVGESIIGKILNHKSNITKKYIHLEDPHLHEALEKMNDTFLSQEICQL
jgi:integrase